MKKLYYLIIPVLITVCLSNPVSTQPPDDKGASLPKRPEDIKTPELVFAPPAIPPEHLENGVDFFILQDTSLPLVSINGYFPAGEILVNPSSSGLAELTATMMRLGGAGVLSGDSVDNVLDFYGINLSVSIGREYGNFHLSSLTSSIDTGLRILQDIFERPRFDGEKLELEKSKKIDAVKRQWDRPGTIAHNFFRKSIYGETSPWAHIPTVETVSTISREDVITFYKNYIHPEGMAVGVYGDIEPDKMKDYFKQWSASKPKKLQHNKLSPVSDMKPEIIQVQKELTQTNLMIGHLGANRLSPGKFPLKVMNFILGEGDFYSRLMREVRSNRGLAYSVWGGVGFGKDLGEFYIVCQTKSNSTVETIKLIEDIIEGMTEKEPTIEEFNTAKNSLKNQFVFFFTPPEKIIFEATRQYFLGYPKDYMQTYLDRIDKVTGSDVLRVAREYLHPDKFHLVAVGNEDDYDTPLSSFGKVIHKKIPDSNPAAPGK